MALPSNPQTLASYDITKSDQAKIFVKKVSDLFLAFTVEFTSGFISGLLNGVSSIFNTALFYKAVDLGTVATNQTVDCTNAVAVAVSMTVATAVAITLSLTHLAIGVPVTVAFSNTSGSSRTFFVNATLPSGSAITVTWKTSSGPVNMTITGLAVGNGGTLIGSGSATPTGLYQVAN